jgi:octaprenyl-diphosphate synthase
MQLAAAKNLDTTEDAYLAVIRAKTAELFAAACEVGPVIAGTAESGAGGLLLVRQQSRHRLPARR